MPAEHHFRFPACGICMRTASRDENLDYEQIAREILEEAKPPRGWWSTRPRTSSTATFGDELPEQLRIERLEPWLGRAARAAIQQSPQGRRTPSTAGIISAGSTRPRRARSAAR
jgi:hypothetical protein